MKTKMEVVSGRVARRAGHRDQIRRDASSEDAPIELPEGSRENMGQPRRRNVRLAFWLVALGVLVLHARLPGATVVVDQSYAGTPQIGWNAGVGGYEPWYNGETFTAAHSGLLTGIQLHLSWNWGVTNSIDFVIIRNPVQGANPVVGGRVTIPASDVPRRKPGADWYYIDVSSLGFQVTAGQKYGFLMSAHAPWGQSSYYSAIVSADVSNDGSYVKGYLRGEQISCEGLGSALGSRDDADFLFRTFVQVAGGTATAPTIDQQPFPRTAWAGDTASMSVWASGSQPMAYQWFLDGMAIPGATGRFVRFLAVQPGQEGVYSVVVSNAVGVAISSPVLLEVRTQPLLLFSTGPFAAPVGNSFTFSVWAVGRGTLRFQWYQNGLAFPGATGSSYTLAAVSPGDAGVYSVVVTDDLGRSESEPATLTVRDDSSKLRWARALDDGSASITLDDATSTVYVMTRRSSLLAFDLADGGLKYQVSGSLTPSCQTTPLVDNTLFHGSSELVLLARANGAFLRHIPVHDNGPGQPSYYMGPALAVADNGRAFIPAWSVGMTAVDWRQGGVLWEFPVDSKSAYVSGVAYEPSLQTVYFCSRNTLYALWENGSLRWRHDVPGQPSDSEIAPALGYSNLVYYARGKRLSALNALDGQLIWSFDTPDANSQPPVLDQAGRLFTVSGGNLRALDAFTGALLWINPPSTNWGGFSTSPVVLRDGTLAVGAQRVFRLVSAQDGTLLWDYLAGGHVAAYNNNIVVAADGTILFTTDEGKLYALRGHSPMADSFWPTWRGGRAQAGTPNVSPGQQAPALLLNPSAQNLIEGQTARFNASAIGTEPLSYQWFLNGLPITGANQPVLSLTNVVSPQSGSYWVVVTNWAGSVSSAPQPLTVTSLPVLVTTVAGNGTPGVEDGPDGATSRFNQPNGIAVDDSGLIYVADAHSHRLRFVDDSGRTGTLAGDLAPGYADGPGSTARFNFPLGLNLGLKGQVLVADTMNNVIRTVQTVGFHQVATLAGNGLRGNSNGPHEAATFDFPNDVVQDDLGNTFVTEFRNHQIRRIDAHGQVTTWAGNGQPGAADGVGTAASFNAPGGIAIDRLGNLYITEYGGNRIRKVAPDSTVTTLAGSGQAGLRDGYRTEAAFSAPDGIRVGADGTLFLTDHDNNAIRKITPQGYVVTIAGDGTPGYADGLGNVARFRFPSGLALAPNGDLLVADTGNHCLRRLQWSATPASGADGNATLAIELHSAIVLRGTLGAAYQIQAAAQLSPTAWTVLTNLTLTNSPQLWFDPAPASAVRRFYRAVAINP